MSLTLFRRGGFAFFRDARWLGSHTPDAEASDASADAGSGSEVEPATGDGSDAGASLAASVLSGACSTACEDALCPSGQECAPYGECAPYDCGRTIECPQQDTPLYCDVHAHTCHRLDGQCGGEGGGSYSCPTLKGTLPPNTSIVCRDAARGRSSCGFQIADVAPWLGPNVTLDARIVSPENGHTYITGEPIEFTPSGLKAPSFLVVTVGQALDIQQLRAQAIWAASIRRPATLTDQLVVAWSDGSQIDSGRWLTTSWMPPNDTDLYATLLELDGNTVLATTPSPVAFRVGTPWATPGSDCSTGASVATACSNPTLVLACIDSTCRKLCLSDDCPLGMGCRLERDTGLRYCD